MSTGAWIMLIFGCVVLYGGLTWSLLRTKKRRRS
ncbi:MAG: MetS family NSS transporter small subunit [Deltaproteobacteria bacterium]|nr:MetS family NSS transporter small subunit [Deltaproteobacteria bacterium]